MYKITKHFRLVTYSILLEMQMSQACLPVRQIHSLCFSSTAVTLRALWLRVDFWYCAMWNLRPHFEVLYYSWSVRGKHGREETERWITIFWNWYGNLVMCSFTAHHSWVLQYRNGCVTFRVLPTRINTAGDAWANHAADLCLFVLLGLIEQTA